MLFSLCELKGEIKSRGRELSIKNSNIFSNVQITSFKNTLLLTSTVFSSQVLDSWRDLSFSLSGLTVALNFLLAVTSHTHTHAETA